MRFLLLSLLLLACFTSCASQAQQAPKRPKTVVAKTKVKAKKTTTKPQPAAGQPVITFQKTPCFGTCPHYEASIFADGRVRYEGFKYAPVVGKRELKLPVSTVNTILAEARALRFAELPERYTLGATDLPATTLNISPAAGSSKTVVVEEGAPAELQTLLRYIEKQLTDALGVTADR